MFNRRAGINSGTQEGGNQVIINRAGGEGNSFSESELLAKLSQGGTYTIPVFRELSLNKFPLTIEVNSIDNTVNPWHADLSVYECIQDSDCDDLSSCNGVETCNTLSGLCVAGTPAADCCGNGVCEPSAGEDLFTCPADGCTCGPDCLSLETTFSSNAGYAYGNIFKVQALADMAITGFTIHTQDSGSGTVKIWDRAGEWQEDQYTSSGWNEIMNESFTGLGAGQPTQLAKLKTPVFLAATETRSFYFYSSLRVRFLTSAGPLDSIYTQNADLIIHIGKGTGKSALVSFYRMILCIQICSFVDLTTSISNKPMYSYFVLIFFS